MTAWEMMAALDAEATRQFIPAKSRLRLFEEAVRRMRALVKEAHARNESGPWPIEETERQIRLILAEG